MQPEEIDVGRVVAGKYELVRLIGRGAMGEVWLATHTSLGGEFAIKLVRPGDDQDKMAAGRFQLEAQISAKLSRKTRHVVSVSDHGEEEGLAYLVMERLEGESLEERIERPGEIELAEVVAIVMQIARALTQAHGEAIFHRDLKPANVFLTRDEDGRMLVKLLDFGIARSQQPFGTRSPFATGKDMVLGTPSYMSPEQARGLDTLDYRCDVWALAVVAYELLTGTLPWEGETLEDIFLSICTHRVTPIRDRRPDLPGGVQSVFNRAFAPSLEGRFRSAGELSEALEALVDPAAVAAAMGGARPSLLSSPDLSSATSADARPTVRRADEPGVDPGGVAMGETLKLVRRRKRFAGWILAAIATITTVGIIGLALSAFTSREPSTRATPPVAATAVTAVPAERATIPLPAPPAAPVSTATETALAPAVAKARPRGGAAPRATAIVVPAAPSPSPSPPPPPSPSPPDVPVAKPAPSPPPTVRKPPDKGEVF